MATKKPGDETIQGLPGFATGPEHPRPIPEVRTAPEVSQGVWRERVYTPRAVLSREEINSQLLSSLRVLMASANHPKPALEQLLEAWRPLFRQALEQSGGDGVDAWLSALLTPPARPARHPLFADLAEALLRLRASKDLASLEEEALKTAALIDHAYDASPPKHSFKVTEKQLEGKLEIDELLWIRGGPTDELSRRMEEIGATMEQLRDQLKRLPGARPNGMFVNFVRLKAELRVLDGELKRRQARGG